MATQAEVKTETDSLDLAISKTDRIVYGIHECVPDHSTHAVRVGDLRFLQRALRAAKRRHQGLLGDASKPM